MRNQARDARGLRQAGTFVALVAAIAVTSLATAYAFGGGAARPHRTTTMIDRAAGTAKDQVEARPEGGGEGITVHGRWTITLLDPDGTVARIDRFENALQTDGATTLAGLLSRTKSPGLWQVVLFGSGPDPCNPPSGTGDTPCYLLEPTSLSPGGGPIFKNLTVTGSEGKVVLAGSATAGHDTSIGRVDTFLTTCDPGTPPSAVCNNQEAGKGFTFKAGLSIPVQADQSIAVRVEISFS